jgi:hypothetical protein
MNHGLLMIERIVIESLSKKEKNIVELEVDTGLSHALLLNILPNLLMKNIVLYQRGIYSLEQLNKETWLAEINKADHVKFEAKEMFTSLVNQYFEANGTKVKEGQVPQLKIQKIWLTESEEKILKSHLATLDGFFLGIKEARKYNPLREKTSEQRVVIWGTSLYSDLIDGVLKAV